MTGRSRPVHAPLHPARLRVALLLALLALAGGPAVAQTVCQDADCEAAHRLIVMVDGLLGGGESIGAGIIVGHRANRLYVATAGHVVRSPNAPAPATDLRVTFAGLPGESFPAQLASDDASALGGLDLAVLIVPDVIGTVIDPADLPFERLGDAAVLTPGDIVRTLGQDRGLEWYTPVSPIRFARRERDTLVIESSVNRPGSSGGGLFSEDWALVGMVVSSAQPEVRALSIDAVLEALGARNYPIALAPAAVPAATVGQEDADAGPAEAEPDLTPEPATEPATEPAAADPDPADPLAGADAAALALIVRAGFDHTLALAEDGTVWAWGDNEFGQLGDGTTASSEVPVPVVGLSDVVDLSAGDAHSLALRGDGTVWAWGDNEIGQLGDGTTTDRAAPVQVLYLEDVAIIGGGDGFSLAVAEDGTVWTWGANDAGQLGFTDEAFRSEADWVDVGEVADAAAGFDFTLALLVDGTLRAWGANGSGELGDGTTTDRTTPVRVSGF